MDNSIKNKKVLYIGPPFFGYEMEIQEALASKGAIVEFYNERVFVSTVGRILVRLGITFFLKKTISLYYSQIVELVKEKEFDYLFVVSPEVMPPDFVRKVKEINPRIVAILYMWDSIVNKKNSGRLFSAFDRVFTFDRRDNRVYPDAEFLPLFYGPEFELVASLVASNEPKYAVAFIGTVHSDRYKLVKKIEQQVAFLGKKSYLYFYCPSRIVYFLKKVFTSEFTGVHYAEVKFKPLNRKEVFDILVESEAVIDVEHPSQQGLTMRTIEMLGAGKKLITTNKDVKNYDFYHESSICVVDRSNPVVSDEFILGQYVTPDDDVVLRYSLSSWIDRIFGAR